MKKEIHDEKKREFRNVEQDKWRFFFSFFSGGGRLSGRLRMPAPQPSSMSVFPFSVLSNFATWQSVLELALLHGRIQGLSVQLHGAKICS
jgi:hypothetical protein